MNRALCAAGRPARGETLVVGLSGGPDSVALLDALALLRGPGGFRLVAAHLDHGLRPGSAEDAAFCAELCRGLDVPLRTGVADVRARAERERGGLEQAARRERYAFLRHVAAREEAAAVAVAHTRDDQAETFLLRLLRGAAATGLGGMRTSRPGLIRPLLGVSRQDVLVHLGARGLPWREDPTNALPVHVRNRVRHELLPYLESRFNPRIREVLARSATLLADEADHVAAEADALFGRIGREERGGVVLLRSGLAQAPAAIARATLRRALRRCGGLRQVGASHVEQLLRLARGPATAGRRVGLPGGREARFTRDELQLQGPPGKPAEAVSSRRAR